MDVLSDVLASVRLTGAVFFDSTFYAEFVAESPKASAIAAKVMPASQYVFFFHTLLEGSCYAEMTDDSLEPVRLEAGDIIAFPLDDGHALCSTVGLRAAPDMAIYIHPMDRQLPYVLNSGSGDSTCRFICGYLGCDVEPYNPLMQSLPRRLLGRGVAGKGGLSHLIQYAAIETEQHQSGGEAVLARIAELLFIEVVRQHVQSLADETPDWLSGLRDPHIGQALCLIHGQPAAPWTLQRLAREVGMSRSVFAERFHYFVGISPMQYLVRWRMQLAQRQLELPGASISRVSALIGYGSEAAFNRAFKKLMGVPPGQWRKRHAGQFMAATMN